MEIIMKRFLVTLLLAGASSLCLPAAPIFQLNPGNGVVAGMPGATVGWGFTLTDTADWIAITGSSFTPSSPLGTYDDYIGTGPLIVVGPSPENTSLSQLFNSLLRTGVGGFHINGNAPVATIGGTIVVTYSEFSQDPNDPNFNPDNSTVVADGSFSQSATVNVVPEPASLSLIVAGVLPLAMVNRRRRRNRL
jgi:hypothetical protein